MSSIPASPKMCGSILWKRSGVANFHFQSSDRGDLLSVQSVLNASHSKEEAIEARAAGLRVFWH
jgi:hypothetical protein